MLAGHSLHSKGCLQNMFTFCLGCLTHFKISQGIKEFWKYWKMPFLFIPNVILTEVLSNQTWWHFFRHPVLSCCPGWLCCTSCGYPRPGQTRPLHPGYGDLMMKTSLSFDSLNVLTKHWIAICYIWFEDWIFSRINEIYWKFNLENIYSFSTVTEQ